MWVDWELEFDGSNRFQIKYLQTRPTILSDRGCRQKLNSRNAQLKLNYLKCIPNKESIEKKQFKI